VEVDHTFVAVLHGKVFQREEGNSVLIEVSEIKYNIHKYRHLYARLIVMGDCDVTCCAWEGYL